MSAVLPFSFCAGTDGPWRIVRIAAVAGEPMPPAQRLRIEEGLFASASGAWTLRGVTSHTRYVERREKDALDAISPPLGRPEATLAALIPIRKRAGWWALPQDERRAIFEQRTRHIADSLPYLPRVARRLYHARDLGEPFDFLTWFEYAPEHSSAFEELVAKLRAREEWTFVEREVDVRLAR